LLLFTFFMISDPKTTPDARAGRVLFGVLVAIGAWWITFRWFRTNGLLWSLAFFSLCVPFIDRLLPGARYDSRAPRGPSSPPPEQTRAPRAPAAPGPPLPPPA